MMWTDRMYADIYLDRIEHNMQAVQECLTPGTMVIGIVKADGYGHGAAPVAKIIDPFVSGYGVATIDEALHLRKNGITKGILVLGPVAECRYPELVREEIRPALFRYDEAKTLSAEAEKQGKKAKIHIAVDTGMGRIGLFPDERAAETVKRIAALGGIEIEGMFTHFSRADETDRTYTEMQLRKLRAFTAMVKERGVVLPMVHCSNSAGIIDYRDADMDAVRVGIILYGLYPSDETSRLKGGLLPAMELKSRITYIKEVDAGTAISYGGTFVTDRRTKVATICAGYGDGYPRGLSGKGEILVCGKRAPILGRVCMDQFMADVTDIPEAHEGCVVTLLGRDGSEEITMEELAARSGGFHYELPCIIGKRVPRRYLYRGKAVGAISWTGGEYEDYGEF